MYFVWREKTRTQLQAHRGDVEIWIGATCRLGGGATGPLCCHALPLPLWRLRAVSPANGRGLSSQPIYRRREE